MAFGTGNAADNGDAISKSQFDALVTQDVRPAASPGFVEVTMTQGAPTANGTGVTISAPRPGVRAVTLTFLNTPIPLVDEAGVVAYGSLKIIDMPAGAICSLGATSNLAVTKSSAGVNADWDGDFGIGTAACGNNAVLAGTEQNILGTTPTPQAVAGATTANGQTATADVGTVFDGASGAAVDVYLNFLVDDTDHNVGATPCNLILNGTITFVYANLGDY